MVGSKNAIWRIRGTNLNCYLGNRIMIIEVKGINRGGNGVKRVVYEIRYDEKKTRLNRYDANFLGG